MRAGALLGLAVLGIGGCAGSAALRASEEAAAQRELAEALAGRVAGAPVDCVDADRAGTPQIVGHETLLYRPVGGKIWRNDIAGCPALREGAILVIEPQGTRLCRNDRFRLLDHGAPVPSGYCRLGSFTPYARP